MLLLSCLSYLIRTIQMSQESQDKRERALALENQNLKNEARNLRSSIEAARIGEKEITNVDLLRRISQLEKIILGKSEQ